MSSLSRQDIVEQSMLNIKGKLFAPLYERIRSLPLQECIASFGDTVTIATHEPLSHEAKELLYDLKPWRKGPFCINHIFVDTEWQSYMKYNLLAPYLNIEDKIVGDIGCNNGYYMFRMLDKKPKKLIGFDPGVHVYLQFLFLNHFINAPIEYYLLGVEELTFFEDEFDTLLFLGVLYHRTDPIMSLKKLFRSLRKKGEMILDCFMIDGEEEMVLSPSKTYSKIGNVHFVPTIKALMGWLDKAGFHSHEVLAIVPTTTEEQRKTEWIIGQSLESFLDPNDPTKTVEGYPAPKRVYIRTFKG